MFLGYNTNGFAHHRLDDTLSILAELGYRGLALTLDWHCLNPFDEDLWPNVKKLRQRLQQLQMACVVETGARFLLDIRRKHQPILLSTNAEERQIRFNFLARAIDIAAELEADAVSFWSGTPAESAENNDHGLLDLLADNCHRLCLHAETRKIRLAFEPEPGMFIDTMERFARLFQKVQHPLFGLTLDVGHLHCLEEFPISAHIHKWQEVLWNLHIEDMRVGVHDHLMFGEGDMQFPPIFDALREIDYQGGLFVELSRHSHNAVQTASDAMAFLKPLV